jgi:hypothetical protein
MTENESDEVQEVLVFGGSRKMMRTSAMYMLEINHLRNIIKAKECPIYENIQED